MGEGRRALAVGVEPDEVEIRVLGCLLEKQRTTPDAYPLTLNALRLACNQSSNRDPIVDYDEAAIRAALERLGHRRWTRAASGAGSRAAKHRQLFDEALGLSPAQTALLTVLMLRGAQTPGELKTRIARMHPLPELGDVVATLEELAERGLVERLDRRPGEKQERWRQLVGAGPGADGSEEGLQAERGLSRRGSDEGDGSGVGAASASAAESGLAAGGSSFGAGEFSPGRGRSPQRHPIRSEMPASTASSPKSPHCARSYARFATNSAPERHEPRPAERVERRGVGDISAL